MWYSIMPFKRTRRTFRKRPKKFIKKFRRVPRRLSSAANRIGVHWFKRTVNAINDTGFVADGLYCTEAQNTLRFNSDPTTSLAGGSAAYGTFSYFFSLQSLPDVGEFTALFDQYRIRKVVVKIYPYTSSTVSAPAGQAGVIYPSMGPILHTVIDHDDATAPTAAESGIQTLQEYVSYKRFRLTDSSRRPITIVIKPHVAAPVYQASAFSAYSDGGRNRWLDCANSAIEHYSLKGIIEGIQPYANTNYVYPMRIETTYYIQCRGPR